MQSKNSGTFTLFYSIIPEMFIYNVIFLFSLNLSLNFSGRAAL
jgi:hypothetical protein